MDTLIVGEAPSSRTSGGSKKRIGDLAGAPVEDWATWVNLLEDYPGRNGKGSGWNLPAAKSRASSLDFSVYRLVVLLGRRVAAAVLPGGAGIPFFRKFEHRGARFVVIPHPSGIVRWWNDAANVEKAGRFLSSIAAEQGIPTSERFGTIDPVISGGRELLQLPSLAGASSAGSRTRR